MKSSSDVAGDLFQSLSCESRSVWLRRGCGRSAELVKVPYIIH